MTFIITDDLSDLSFSGEDSELVDVIKYDLEGYLLSSDNPPDMDELIEAAEDEDFDYVEGIITSYGFTLRRS